MYVFLCQFHCLQLGGILVDQMSLAAQQIGDAAKRLQELLEKAKAEQSGI